MGLYKRSWNKILGKAPERIYLIDDGAGWVLSEEMKEVGKVARSLGIPVADNEVLLQDRNQGVFYACQFQGVKSQVNRSGNRFGFPYFHGKPGSGYPEFDDCYELFCKRHDEVSCLQVSHQEMEQVILESGIAPHKIHRIPIGINLDYFQPVTLEQRRQMRKQYGIPESAFVVGSFQKDGNGWGEGFEPKLIKGPDVLVETMKQLKAKIPELFVFLSGPSRGYVKKGLEESGIPYQHTFLEDYLDVGGLYQGLDAYVVAARQEGGPKAILEAMASGIPIVSTRVGQATDLIKHEENGWLSDVENAEALADCLYQVCQSSSVEKQCAAGLSTAAENSYAAQKPLWAKLFEQLVHGE